MKIFGFTVRADPAVPVGEIRMVTVGPWEKAHREAYPDLADDHDSISLRYCKQMDAAGIPAITPKNLAPRSRFLRAMYGLPQMPDSE